MCINEQYPLYQQGWALQLQLKRDAFSWSWSAEV